VRSVDGLNGGKPVCEAKREFNGRGGDGRARGPDYRHTPGSDSTVISNIAIPQI
jgi:hypothetical protein